MCFTRCTPRLPGKLPEPSACRQIFFFFLERGKGGTPNKNTFHFFYCSHKFQVWRNKSLRKARHKRNVITLLDVCFQSSFLGAPPCYSKQEEPRDRHLGAGEKSRATQLAHSESAGAGTRQVLRWNSAGARCGLCCWAALPYLVIFPSRSPHPHDLLPETVPPFVVC